MSTGDALLWLQDWYSRQCDGDWEHGYGVKIDTLDNPGWHVQVSLIDTELEKRSLERHEVERSDNDWLRCWRTEQDFCGVGGPSNLNEILSFFRAWTERSE